MATLVIAEHNNQQLNESTARTITAATKLGDVCVLVAGYQCQAVAEAAAKYVGVNRVIKVDAAVLQHQLAENMSQLVVALVKGLPQGLLKELLKNGQANEFKNILAPATTFGKNILPRVAALLDVSQVSDVIRIESADTFVRPIYAGNAFATVQSTDAIKVLTIRTSAFNPTQIAENSCSIDTLDLAGQIEQLGQIDQLDQIQNNKLSTFVGHELTQSARPELTSAKVIISGGRGLQSGDNFKLLEQLADKLNAAIGASRAAVDAGFVPNDYQVGQTGKIVAPDLYIAIGISGAIQHLAGMKDSKIIVAINKDEDAPIFNVADYGIVGDLFEIVPQLIEELSLSEVK